MEINYNCLVDKHISNTIKKFFLCTHIPIKAFRFDGILIDSIGYNREFEELFDLQDIYEKLFKESVAKESSTFVTISIGKNTFFVACRICPKSINRGIYVIGPYSTMNNSDDGFLYKPAECIPHLISLIYNIGADSAYMKHKNIVNEAIHSIYVKKALDFLDARYTEQITLNDITNFLQISRCYFCSLVKKETNKTFSTLLNEIRIEKSKELLLTGNLSILEIALSVGFNNQNYYTMTFKKLTKMTPIEYKNKNRHL